MADISMGLATIMWGLIIVALLIEARRPKGPWSW